MSEPAPLALRHVSHRYGDTETLRGVSLDVGRGRIVSVLGPSGAGKTTLLRAIAGFATPHAGTIAIEGVTVSSGGRERVPAEQRRVGMVFQDYALFPHLSVAENVAFGIHRSANRARRVAGLLELVGLADRATRRPAELSGGQQQRVALARALAPRPALLLLDEPFANLDEDRRTRLITDLGHLLRVERASVLLVTHNRAEALAISDEVVVLAGGPAGGRVLQCGSPEEVYWRPVDERVARITGDLQVVGGEAQGSAADTPLGRVPLREQRRGPVRLLVRPEALQWNGDGAGTATVLRRQFVGRGYRVWCTTAVGELCVECSPAAAPPVGASGSVSVHTACHAFADEAREA